jgi:transposase
MSLRAPLFYLIPEQTAHVAQAAFPKGNPYMRMRDALGPIYTNPDFAQLFPNDGQPAQAPAQLALITIMQFAEGLSDDQTITAVRARIDWKYALALELTDPGFDASVLSEFRTRLLAGNAELLLFESMLTLFREQGLVKAKGRQRTDSTHVLAAIQVLNRLECVGETLRHALNVLATEVPDWLQTWVPSVWFDRYSRRFEEYRLPAEKPARYALAEQIGADGRQLLLHLYHPDTPLHLRDLPAVQVVRHVWLQQFHAAPLDQPVRWRIAEDLPPAPLLISSPYDPDARYGKKRRTEWTGYKVHITETCDDDTPHLITDVLTTPATTSDFDVLPIIQQQLAARSLTPSEQIVDSGYPTADHLLTSQTTYAIDVLGPVATDHSWQAKADAGFAAAQFVIDWDAQQATCPQGHTSVLWLPRENAQDEPSIHIKFAKADCAGCPVRAQCTQSPTQPRLLQVRDQDHYVVLKAARDRQQTELFKEQYAVRAGIEGTISQGVRMGDLRRSRYRGLPKTRLLHLLIAAALNFIRVAAWLAETPRAHTRTSAFARLAPASG